MLHIVKHISPQQMTAPPDSSGLIGISAAAVADYQLAIAILTFVIAAALVSFIGRCLSEGGGAWVCRPPSLGPAGWPLLGLLPTMSGGLAHVKLAEMAACRGAKRLMSFSIGATPAVISSHPDVARLILSDPLVADRPVKESAHRLLFHRALGFAPYGEYWRGLRRICSTHLFCPKRISAFQVHRQSIADRMLREIGEAMASQGCVVVRDILRRASLDNIMVMVFGRNYDEEEWEAERQELSGLVEECYELLGKINWSDHLPLLSCLDLQGVRRRSQRLLPRVRRFVGNIVREHRQDASATANDDSADFVDVLLSLGDGLRLSEDDMIALLWEMIFRGTDTIAIVMEWTLARMVRHADSQQIAYTELQKALNGKEKPSEEDINNAEYLQAVVKEVLRLHPPGPLLSWARFTTDAVDVDGQVVPASTTAMVNMWAICHDEGVWKDAEAFLPQRFVAGMGGEVVNVMGKDVRLAPFGSGRRVCPGKALAMSTINLWVSRLLFEFQWLPRHSGCLPDISEGLRLSCEMKVPLCAVAVRRE